MRHLEFLNRAITNYFTFWIIIFSVMAFLEPAPFAGLTYLIVPTLGVIMLGMDVARARAISIEVGIQNSGLAAALANTYFDALAALPGAVFSIWHNISGSAIAWWWRRHSQGAEKAGGR